MLWPTAVTSGLFFPMCISCCCSFWVFFRCLSFRSSPGLKCHWSRGCTWASSLYLSTYLLPLPLFWSGFWDIMLSDFFLPWFYSFPDAALRSVPTSLNQFWNSIPLLPILPKIPGSWNNPICHRTMPNSLLPVSLWNRQFSSSLIRNCFSFYSSLIYDNFPILR